MKFLDWCTQQWVDDNWNAFILLVLMLLFFWGALVLVVFVVITIYENFGAIGAFVPVVLLPSWYIWTQYKKDTKDDS